MDEPSAAGAFLIYPTSSHEKTMKQLNLKKDLDDILEEVTIERLTIVAEEEVNHAGYVRVTITAHGYMQEEDRDGSEE
jgi:hypothetical protein